MRVCYLWLLLLPLLAWADGKVACPPECPDFTALSGAQQQVLNQEPSQEWPLSVGGARVQLGQGLSVRLPLELRPGAPPPPPSASNNYQLQPDAGIRAGVRRLRPELNLQGDRVDTRLRLTGSKVQLRFQNKDESQRVQVTLKADEAKLEYRWRF